METIDTIMGGILNPENAFDYEKKSATIFTYKDSLDNIFCLRLVKIENLKYEIELSWIDENGIYIIEPAFPSNVIAEDNNKRGNTVSKIFVNEILPLVRDKKLELYVKPFEENRYAFCKRLLEKFVTEDLNLIEENSQFSITIK